MAQKAAAESPSPGEAAFAKDMAAVTAWLEGGGEGAAPVLTSAAAVPPLAAADAGADAAPPVPAQSGADLAREHLRALDYELESAASPTLRARRDALATHFELVDRARSACALFHATPDVRPKRATPPPVAHPTQKTPVSFLRESAAARAPHVSPGPSCAEYPPWHISGDSVMPPVSLSGSEADSAAGEYEPEISDVQLTYEHLIYAVKRVNRAIVALCSRAETALRTPALNPSPARALRKEVRALELLTVTKSVLLLHGVRIMEITCLSMAGGAIEGSRIAASPFDLGLLRSRVRILLYVRRRMREMQECAYRALLLMDREPFKPFAPIMISNDLVQDQVLRRRVSARCDTVKNHARSALPLVLNIEKTKAAVEDHLHCMISADLAAVALLALRRSEVNSSQSSVALKAVDDALRTTSESIRKQQAELSYHKKGLTEAFNLEAEGVESKVLQQRLSLAWEGFHNLQGRLELFSSIQRQLTSGVRQLPWQVSASSMSYCVEQLKLVIRGACVDDAGIHSLSIVDEDCVEFAYSSFDSQREAKIIHAHATEVIGALEHLDAPMQCEVMTALQVVFGDSSLCFDVLKKERATLMSKLTSELERQKLHRARLPNGKSAPNSPDSMQDGRSAAAFERLFAESPGASRGSPRFPEISPRPLSRPLESGVPSPTPDVCFVCTKNRGNWSLPCCGSCLCEACGRSWHDLLGRCPKCRQPWRIEDIKVLH